MADIQQESLLPGTKAIQKGTLEIAPYRGGWLVRYKSAGGATYQHRGKTFDEVKPFYDKYFRELQQDAAATRIEKKENPGGL